MAQPQARANLIETVNKVVRTSCQMLPEIGREPTAEAPNCSNRARASGMGTRSTEPLRRDWWPRGAHRFA
jgi:hypothetical protein